jgi:hypothetical protein
MLINGGRAGLSVSVFEMIFEVLRISLLVTSFVFTMMMLVEFLNVSTTGLISKWLGKGSILNFIAIVLIGATPGCLGAFTTVALFIHGVVSRGVVVGSMIAASGDEAFFMLAMMPKTAFLLFAFLIVYGIAVGLLTDKIFDRKGYKGQKCDQGLVLHEEEGEKADSAKRTSFREWSFLRVFLLFAFGSVTVGVIMGWIGEEGWNWERIALLVTTVLGFIIIFLASDHFIKEHLIHHIAKEHLLKLFLWTFFALLAMELLKFKGQYVEALIQNNAAFAIIVAALIGLLPESGPHMIFVAGFVSGVVPFSVLVTSSVVQDGHGMLPLLAQSPSEFIKIKSINFIAGILAGFAFLALGF